ncbi:Protein M04G7.3 b [Aphelenchoides avenae]|nr:Protein M04G7.3 b [Aphelenchus avenae]
MVVCYHSIESTSILLTGANVMWDQQALVVVTHGVVSAATTASTLLVVFITFQRFLVVWWPLRKCLSEDTRATRIQSQVNIEVKGNPLNQRHIGYGRGKLGALVLFSFMLNSTVFFEFTMSPCFAVEHEQLSTHLVPTALRQNQAYNGLRTVAMMATQTIGPISIISLLTAITEHKVYSSLRARKMLFECQQRRRSVVLSEELREKLSRTVAIFIAVKFIILRSLPVFFDLYETMNGIESFGVVLSILVRMSDFGVVMNSATNSLAYFGKTKWLENRLRGRLLRKQHSLTVDATSGSLESLKR